MPFTNSTNLHLIKYTHRHPESAYSVEKHPTGFKKMINHKVTKDSNTEVI